MNKSLLLFLVLVFASTSLIGQKYKVYTKVKGVEISTKWLSPSKMKRDAPLQLLIKAENTNDYNVDLSLSVALYLDGILEEQSAPSSIPIKAGKTLQGKLNGLFFESDKLSNEQIRSDKFDYEILDIEVEERE
jgi:hypothetical protein